VNDWRGELSCHAREALEASPHPEWCSPMLATLTHEQFSDSDWLFEPKLDGERLLAFRSGDKTRLMTRNRNSAAETYPELIESLKRQSISDFVVAGEVVAFDNGISSFLRLQQRMKISDCDKACTSDVSVHLYLFDLIHVDRHRLDALPLQTRKRLLRDLFDFESPLHFTPHRNTEGEAFFKEACKKGWEGIITKCAASRYRQSRSRDWFKFKCQQGQELVIAGFTKPQGQRQGFGALLVGYYDDGKLRHPRFLGLRRDKKPVEVTREASDD